MSKKVKVAFTVRLDKDIKDTFNNICEQKDLPQSVVIRQLMNQFIKDNSQFKLDLRD